MDGPGLIQLTLDTIPQTIERVLAEGELCASDVQLFLVQNLVFLNRHWGPPFDVVAS